MPNKRPSVKNEKQYEGLKKKGMSKSRAARIANSLGAPKRGGKKSGSGSARGAPPRRAARRSRRSRPAAKAGRQPHERGDQGDSSSSKSSVTCSTSIARRTIGRRLVKTSRRFARSVLARRVMVSSPDESAKVSLVQSIRVTLGARDLVDAALKLGLGRDIELTDELDPHTAFGSLDGDP